MDVIDWLKVVLREASFVSDPAEGLRAVSDIGVDCPPLISMQLDTDEWSGFPVRFSSELSQATVPVLEEALTRREHEDLSLLTPEDPLVRVLTELLLEATAVSQRSVSLLMLELARQSSQGIAGEDKELWKTNPAAARVLGEAVATLPTEAAARGEALAEVVWSLSARLGMAWSTAAQLDPTIQPTRFYQALVSSKLAWVVPAGGLELPRDIALVAKVLGTRSRTELLIYAHSAARIAIEAVLADDDKGLGIRHLATGRSDPDVLAVDPLVVSAVMAILPTLVDAKALRKAGLPKAMAKGLAAGQGAGSLTASFLPLCGALRTWDVLASAATHCAPVWMQGGAWFCRHGTLKPGQPWGLLAPRTGSGKATVVGVHMGGLAQTAEEEALRHGPVVHSTLRDLWKRLGQHAVELGGVASIPNGPWYAAFETTDQATDFARLVRETLKPPFSLQLEPFGPSVILPHHAPVPVSVVSGNVTGGWDGQSLALGGSALMQALGIGSDPLEDEADEGVGEGANLLREVDFEGRAAPVDHDPFMDETPLAEEEPPSDDPFAAMPAAVGDPFASDDTPAASEEADPFALDDEAPSSTSGDPFAADPFAEPAIDPREDPASIDTIDADPSDDSPDTAQSEPESLLVETDPPEDSPPLTRAELPEQPEMTLDIEDDEDDDSYVPSQEVEQFFLPPPDPSPPLDDPGPPTSSATGTSEPGESFSTGLEDLGLTSADLAYLLEGYVMYREAGEVVIGRQAGGSLEDIHRYTDSGTAPPYRAFMMDKIEEHFLPQADRTGAVPSGVELQGLNIQEVTTALLDA